MEVRSGIEVLTTLDERVDPHHSAVIVVDMQNDYCSPGGASDRNGRDISAIATILPPMCALLERARALDIPRIYTKYSVGPGNAGLSGPEILRRGLNFAGVQATIKGTWGHEIVADLPFDPEADLVIEKRRLSSFVGTDLDLYLRANGLKTLVVVGVVTQGCVECTARDAASYDYYVALASDCVASTTRVDHERGLQSIATLLRYPDAVTSSDAILDIWSRS
ncbi:MAG: cysteine hydrolase family protein [Chloroflexota bacterium]